MKKITLLIAIVMATALQAETLIQTLTGSVGQGSGSSRTHPLDLKKGKYSYVLTLKGHKKAKVRFRIKRKRSSGVPKKLIDAKSLRKGTHEGTFTVDGSPIPSTKKVNFIISKKIGGGPKKRMKYVLEIYKK